MSMLRRVAISEVLGQLNVRLKDLEFQIKDLQKCLVDIKEDVNSISEINKEENILNEIKIT